MSYYQIIFSTTSEKADWLSDLITEAGALAVSLLDAQDQPIFEPKIGSMPLWQEVEIEALFNNQTDAEEALALLKNWLDDIPSYRTLELAERNWVQETQAQFQPQCFADKLWVYPEWHPVDPNHKLHIKIAPGLAFGTGTHPTTQLCLTWLAKYLQPGSTVIDYGCGSGILALAALALGANEVTAIDNDPQALEATLQNITYNNFPTEKLKAFLPEQTPAEYQADVVVANILAGPLCELQPIICKLLKPNSQLVLSGILLDQAEMVIKAYEKTIQLKLIDQKEDWCCLASD